MTYGDGFTCQLNLLLSPLLPLLPPSLHTATTTYYWTLIVSLHPTSELEPRGLHPSLLVPHSIMFRLRPLSHHRPRRIEGAEPVPNVLEQEECATRAEHTHHLPPS